LWLKSYLSGRRQYFSLYTSPIASIASSFGVKQQQYADDTQLYIHISPSSQTASLDQLKTCLATINSWFCHNGLALNPDKTEALLLGTSKRASSYSTIQSVDVAGATIGLSKEIKLLGAVLDSNLTLTSHVNAISKSCFGHIRALRHIRNAISLDTAKSVACSLVASRIDYANSILAGASSGNITRLQRVQNCLARVVTGKKLYSVESHSLLEQLHWLPVRYRVSYKVSILAFKCRNGLAPNYLSGLLSDYIPPRTLRSSDANLLAVPRVKTQFGSRGFRVTAPTAWNALSDDVRLSPNLSTFKERLKTFHFRQAFPH